MSDRSSSGSSHSLRSRGTIEAAAASGTSRKAPAVWSKAEETAFLEFLLKALPSSGDGGFKTTTFNQAATHLKEKFTQQRGAEKTGVVCKNKWTAVRLVNFSATANDIIYFCSSRKHIIVSLRSSALQDSPGVMSMEQVLPIERMMSGRVLPR